MSKGARRIPPQIREPFEKPAVSIASYYVKVSVADVRAYPSEQEELVTQALLGDEIRIIEDENDWVQAEVPDGYIGWIKKDTIVKTIPPKYEDIVAITAPSTKLYQDPGLKVIGEALLGTDVPYLDENNKWFKVWVPGQGSVWVLKKDAELWPDGKVPDTPRSGEDVINVANRLRGVHYLWGGVSRYGIDCSGLVYVSYFLNGIKLPRDADQQFEVGQEVEKRDLEPGDLVFFNTDGFDSVPTHVGIYLKNGYFINSRSRMGVVISHLNEPIFVKGYLGARRYLQK
ncbi:MAG: hypothetical protein PWP31_47 [Clostridia bacterium]|nr:hypothetical protein [Clostridia bacterium]